MSDGARKKLEGQLDEERRVRAREEQRARDVVKVRANYEAASVEDLDRMAEQHRRATKPSETFCAYSKTPSPTASAPKASPSGRIGRRNERRFWTPFLSPCRLRKRCGSISQGLLRSSSKNGSTDSYLDRMKKNGQK